MPSLQGRGKSGIDTAALDSLQQAVKFLEDNRGIQVAALPHKVLPFSQSAQHYLSTTCPCKPYTN